MIRRMIMIVLLLALAATMAWAKKYQAFQIPEAQFRSSIKTVVLLAPSMNKDITRQVEVAALFDSLITLELVSAGLTVVPGREYDQLWKHGLDSLGGIFDPATGQPDTAKAHGLRRQVVLALKDRFHIDGVVRPGLVPTSAAFSGSTARWDGAKQTMTKGLGGFLAANGAYGHIPALSLYLAIEDLEGTGLYLDTGGIHVLSKLALGAKFVDLPADSALANAERNVNAVKLATAQLTTADDKK